MTNIDYFYEASKLFLTEPLTEKEWDDIANEGSYIPRSSDFEEWDLDYLEDFIRDAAELIKENVEKHDSSFKESTEK